MTTQDRQIEDRANAARRLQEAIDVLDVLIRIGAPTPSLGLEPELTPAARAQVQATRDVLQAALDAVTAQHDRLIHALLARLAGARDAD